MSREIEDDGSPTRRDTEDDGSPVDTCVVVTRNNVFNSVWWDEDDAEEFVDRNNLPFYKEKKPAPWGFVVTEIR